MTMNPQPCRPIRPDDLQLFEALPGVVAIARDEDLRMFWCSPSFFRFAISREFPSDMKGSRLDDLFTTSAAREREDFHRGVMQSMEVRSHLQVSADRRVICTIYPLDAEAFGHKGVFALLADAPSGLNSGITKEFPVLSSPHLDMLIPLSNRELEVLHFIAQGLSTGDIASKLSRSSKTIEKQINSIHSKLHTHSRAELVRFATERGIQAFSQDEWALIVEGAKKARRELNKIAD